MGIEQGTELISNVFTNTVYFNISWLASVILTLLTLFLLTKDKGKWKELAFPVMLGWHIAGVPPFILLYLIAAVMYALETLSLQTIGSLFTGITFTRPKEGFNYQKLQQQEAKRELRKRAKFNLGKIIGDGATKGPKRKLIDDEMLKNIIKGNK